MSAELDSLCEYRNPHCDGSDLLHGGWCAKEAARSSQAVLAVVRIALRQDEAAPLEQVEAYIAKALKDAGFRVERVNVEWLT